MSRLKKTLQIGALCLSAVIALTAGGAQASNLVPQTWLPGACIPQFAVPMPVFGPAGPIPRVDTLGHPMLQVTMKEINQQVLPAGVDTCTGSVTFGTTRVYGYETKDLFTKAVLGPANWPAVTVEARRNVPTLITYVNELPAFNPLVPNGPGLLQGLVSIDKTVDWTDPTGAATAAGCTMFPQMLPLNPYCMSAYAGPMAAVPHLHGGELPSQYDGGPLAWFTPSASNLKGSSYSSLYNAGPGKAVYLYQNSQEPGTLWFHDHAMGQTRTNVYSGLAAFYFLRDQSREPANLPSGAYEIEMAIQDRQFDTNSQLYFPDGSDANCGLGNALDPCLNGPPPNAANHPFWIPEFFGDVAIVNGAPWPTLNVEPRRYRFRIIEGSNARAYNLDFGAAPVYFIGSDDAYLNTPVPVSKVFLLPGERADLIVDFTAAAGTSVIVTNDAPAPYPSGFAPLDPGSPFATMANIMKFNVSGVPVADPSCNPALGGCTRPKPMVKLTDGAGHVAPGVVIDKKRQIILKEYEGPGGPLMVMVNNTLFMGTMSPSINAIFPTDGVSELPRVGSVELWEVINLTMDAHPMHTHLMQFQILNRESFNTGQPGEPNNYTADWAAAFPGDPVFSPLCTPGVFCPGWGPPLPYNVANADGALGGNPAISPYLKADMTPPDAWESGWKDTAKAFPGKVLRMLVRVAPTSTPVIPNKSLAGYNFFPFDPSKGPGYVWHCHIIDHEDQDMMRPYKVTK